MDDNKKIVGVFDTQEGAVRAIEDLKRQGFTSDEISVVGKNTDEINEVTDETGTKAPETAAAGAATGGLLGGAAGLLAGLGLLAIPGVGPILAAGPIAATLTGAAVGAGAGGIVGGLIGLGIPEDEAREYGDYVDNGKILVMVDADANRNRGVFDTFRTNNSLNSSRYDTMYGAGTYDRT
ncbi:low temperature-induced protein [Cohnella kolymensis]|uniref:Low temperature-induced protein n=1 Tax=Cohnella kolymensis TaxID=1590652 RepID=A0ABR5A5Z6_9BACL|nr:general stress protein [Cohnella kolymensis]KIL36448.1 low temperature-induced protein [Cohnella kolymensis]